MIPLTIIADSTGAWFALGFILIFVAKAALAVFGGDIDADVDVDTDIEVDVNTDGFGFSASDFFSLKGFLNFGVGFCSYWALFGIDKWYNAVGAVFVGLLTMFLLLFVYRACMKLEGNNVGEKPKDLLYRIGTVYSATGSAVIIQLTVNGHIDEIVTVPDEGVDIKDFKAGELAFISRVETPSETSIRFYSKPYSTDKVPAPSGDFGITVEE